MAAARPFTGADRYGPPKLLPARHLSREGGETGIRNRRMGRPAWPIFQDVLTIDLHATDTTPAGMVWVPGITALGTNQTNPADAPEKTSAFWLDRNEVTNREFKEFVDKRGYEKREYWKEPFVKEGKALTWEQAMAEFRDPTGRRGPAAWQLGSYKEGEADFPVGGVSWYEAAAYAAFAGKSLPTVYHWYRAAAIGPLSDILNFSNFAGRGPAQTEMYQRARPFRKL